MNIESIKSKINSAEKILIIPSTKYDYDSIGTSLAMKWYLNKLGKTSDVVLFYEAQGSVKNIDDVGTCLSAAISTFDFHAYDLIILIDGNHFRQFFSNNFQETLNQINTDNIISLDHHLAGDIQELIPNNIVREELAPSTGIILYKNFIEGEFELDKKVANYLLFSLIGDTGGFKYGINQDAFEFAAVLLKAGAEFERINDYRVTQQTMDFTAFIIDKVEYFPEIQTTILSLDQTLRDEISEKFGKTWESDDLMQYFNGFFVNRIDGYNHSFTLKDSSGTTKISYRGTYLSKVDFTDLFQSVGISGGGHKNSAGGASSTSIAELKPKIVEYIKTLFK